MSSLVVSVILATFDRAATEELELAAIELGATELAGSEEVMELSADELGATELAATELGAGLGVMGLGWSNPPPHAKRVALRLSTSRWWAFFMLLP